MSTTDSTNNLNFDTQEEPGHESNSEEEMTTPPSYGVCDSVEQFVKKFPDFEGEYYFGPVFRQNQETRYGGWRWHKWGPYIGEHDISGIEYIYEADGENGNPLIDVQFCFTDNHTHSFGIQYYKYKIDKGNYQMLHAMPNAEQSLYMMMLM